MMVSLTEILPSICRMQTKPLSSSKTWVQMRRNRLQHWKFDLDEDSSYEFSMADYTRDPEASVRPVTITYSYDSSIDYNGTFPIFGATSGLIKFVPDANFVGINYLTVTATDDDLGKNAKL